MATAMALSDGLTYCNCSTLTGLKSRITFAVCLLKSFDQRVIDFSSTVSLYCLQRSHWARHSSTQLNRSFVS